MPSLLRLILVNAAIGFAIAFAFTAVLVWLDVANLRTAAALDGGGWIWLVLLAFFIGLTFASAQVGFAVFNAGRDATEAERRRDGHGD